MKKLITSRLFVPCVLAAALFAGCKSNSTTPPATTLAAPATTQPMLAAVMPSDKSKPSGSQLWANNCSRCHNMQSPDRFSDAQWRVIVHHMRVRANLTGQEERAITEFLQSH